MVKCLDERHGESYTIYHGDCIEILRQLPDGCIDFSVFSPPFSGLYIYNDSIADLGNSATDEEFFEHYAFFAKEMTRVLRPGRVAAVHCKDLVYYRNQKGTAGLRDFPGDLIRAHTAAGLDFHSRVTIWRCPVREMTKTKAHGLLYKQLRADSSFSRQGLPEYFVIFRKWAEEGDEISPVVHTRESFPLDDWQKYASPVWMDTRETDVLPARARCGNDEKHICPMPLDITWRAMRMYSNTGDVVLSPFAGIGSEGYVALKNGRKFVGCELKREYFEQAASHLDAVERQGTLI